MQTRNSYRLITLAIASALVGGLSACNKQESAASLIAQAQAFEQKGDNKAALIQLKNAVVKAPEDAQARLMLARLYLDNVEPVSAEKEVRKAIALGNASIEARLLLLKSLRIQGQNQKVLDESATPAAQGNAEILALRGEAYLGLNQVDKARESFQKAIALQASAPMAMIGLAKLAMLDEKRDAAMVLIEQAIAANPKHTEAMMFKADFLRATSKMAEADAVYDQVLRIEPAHRSAYIEKAYVLASVGKYDAARAALENARKNAPQSLMLNYTQAVLDYAQGRHVAAKESLQKILKVAPDHMPTLLLAGAVDFALGSLPQAEQHLKRYHESNPRNVHSRKLLATVYLRQGQTAAAMALLAPLSDALAEDPGYLGLMGEAHMQARDFDKAAAMFEKAAALSPKMAVLRTSLAMSHLAQGNDTRAIADLETSTKLDGAAARPATLLVLTELRRKNYDKALAAATALETNAPKDPQVYNLKGGVYLAKGDKPNARASFEKALTLQPGFFPAIGNLVQMAIVDNDLDGAQKILQGFVEKNSRHIEALNMLAAIAGARHQPADVTKWLEKSVAENPGVSGPVTTLGMHYLRNGQKDKALSLVRKASASAPREANLLELLGQIQLESGDTDGALNAFSKLAALQPTDPRHQMRLAQVHRALKNDAAAAEDLRKALLIQPDYIEAQVGQAELLVAAGQYPQALALAAQVQKARPNEPVGLILEGNILRMQGKHPQSLRAFEQALAVRKQAPTMILVHASMLANGKNKEADARLAQWLSESKNDPVLTMYAAETLINARQYKAAIERLEPLAKAAPNDAAVLNNLAWAYQQEKDARALPTAERAYELASGSAAVLDTYGGLLAEKGDYARALPILRKAAEVAPLAGDIQYRLASALAKSGDKAGAKAVLDKLLARDKQFSQLEQAKALRGQL